MLQQKPNNTRSKMANLEAPLLRSDEPIFADAKRDRRYSLPVVIAAVIGTMICTIVFYAAWNRGAMSELKFNREVFLAAFPSTAIRETYQQRYNGRVPAGTQVQYETHYCKEGYTASNCKCLGGPSNCGAKCRVVQVTGSSCLCNCSAGKCPKYGVWSMTINCAKKKKPSAISCLFKSCTKGEA